MDQTRGWCSRTGSRQKVWSWILPGRPETGYWSRVKTATLLAGSARQTGLLCPLLQPRRPLGRSRAPSSRNCWTLCACRRWLRGAPPFLRAAVRWIRPKRASLLPSSPCLSPLPRGRKLPSGKFPTSGASPGSRLYFLWISTAAQTSLPAYSRATQQELRTHDWTPVGRGGVYERGGAFFGRLWPISNRQVPEGGV